MDTSPRPSQPTPSSPAPSLDAVELSLLRLKHELEELHAKLEYMGLMLRLEARKPPR